MDALVEGINRWMDGWMDSRLIRGQMDGEAFKFMQVVGGIIGNFDMLDFEYKNDILYYIHLCLVSSSANGRALILQITSLSLLSGASVSSGNRKLVSEKRMRYLWGLLSIFIRHAFAWALHVYSACIYMSIICLFCMHLHEYYMFILHAFAWVLYVYSACIYMSITCLFGMHLHEHYMFIRHAFTWALHVYSACIYMSIICLFCMHLHEHYMFILHAFAWVLYVYSACIYMSITCLFGMHLHEHYMFIRHAFTWVLYVYSACIYMSITCLFGMHLHEHYMFIRHAFTWVLYVYSACICMSIICLFCMHLHHHYSNTDIILKHLIEWQALFTMENKPSLFSSFIRSAVVCFCIL